MGGKTFPAVQFLDTFHDHIKSITKTKPRSPLAFRPLWLGVGQGRKPRGGGRGWRAPEAWESPLLAESPGEGGGSVCSPRCTESPQIVIHSANTDGYSLCAGHFCPGDTGRTRPQGPRASYRTNTGNKQRASSCRRGKKQEEGERRAGAWEWRVRGCGGAAV